MRTSTLAVVTGTRAEYGLLRPVLHKILQNELLQLHLIVTGAHLEDAFGNTVREIEDDIPIAARIPILPNGTDTAADTAKNTAFALNAFVDYFSAHRPDGVMVLGDRYEIFAVGTAAALLGIPLIHISGGDVTSGAADDYFRHCLTKMASLHFPSCADSAERIIRMGENPSRVFNVGGLGDENIRNMALLSREELTQELQFDCSSPYLLVTYHPETMGGVPPIDSFNALLEALGRVKLPCIFTKANADAGGAEINARLDAVCAARKDWICFTSMGALRYLSAMRWCSAVVGNSSSGVVETPTFGTPALNIGTRQDGRMVCTNVLCSEPDAESIHLALLALLTPQFSEAARHTISPYRGADPSGEIVRITAQFLASGQALIPKKFYDGKAGVSDA